MNIANFPWIILVPRINDVSEIFDLNIEHQQRYFEECNFLLKGMSELYLSNKMNIATLGNIVPQLHTHIIVRFTHDDAWPSPVWSHSENNQYNPEEDTGVRWNSVDYSWPIKHPIVSDRDNNLPALSSFSPQ